jgi:hypothetical protein
MMKEIFSAGMEKMVLCSIIKLCRGGITDPPKMAIIKPAAPNLASSPSPFSAIP